MKYFNEKALLRKPSKFHVNEVIALKDDEEVEVASAAIAELSEPNGLKTLKFSVKL